MYHHIQMPYLAPSQHILNINFRITKCHRNMVLPPKNSMGQAVTEGIQIQAEDPICH